MKAIDYVRPVDIPAAIAAKAGAAHAKYLAGGTYLVDLMREYVEQPDLVIDVSRLPLSDIEAGADGSMVLGATATNTAVALDRHVRERFPVLAQAILYGASGQIRNMATVGGNLLQRTRCAYFYDRTARCNKRAPGTGCDAREGFNRMHAILGASEHCIAVQPSDMCVALAMLEASVRVVGSAGTREIPFEAFHRLPDDRPDRDTVLGDDELITGVVIPVLPWARRSLYRKVRDRSSYAFALVSIAAALDLDGTTIAGARLAPGGVAHKPWRAHAAEEALIGAPATAETFRKAAQAELAPAVGLAHNAFKIELAQRVIVDVLQTLAGQGETA